MDGNLRHLSLSLSLSLYVRVRVCVLSFVGCDPRGHGVSGCSDLSRGCTSPMSIPCWGPLHKVTLIHVISLIHTPLDSLLAMLSGT